ncbi:MAG: PaaI family thioesterase [Thermoleophilia bacterium]|nr:PaaI family thioesterase [Thermoleophilia bacterium]
MTAIWEEPVRGTAADPALLALPGVEQLRSFLDGRSPAPPVARLTGRRLLGAEPGRVVYGLPVTGWLVGPKGTLHPGVLAFLADAPLLAAIHSTLPAATPSTTAEVSTTFLGTAEAGDELRAEGRMIHADVTTGLAEAFVRRRDGRVIAHATSRGFILPRLELDGAAPPLEPVAEPAWETPDPYLRPVAGGTVGTEVVAGTSGLDLLRRQLAGDLPRPPIDHLTGMRLVEAAEGRVVFTLPATFWTANEFGSVYGGMLALLAASAGSAAVQTIAPVGTPFAALDMKLNVIRPAFPDGGELRATATVVHAGRRLAIATTEITGAGGKAVALSTGTTMLGEAAAARYQLA